MKKIGLSAAALVLAATSVFAAGLQSGLKVGESVPAFQVVDVSGPNKGKQLCYRCAYGQAPVAAAFIKGNAPEAAAIVTNLQTLVNEQKGKKLQSFVVFMGGADLKPTIEKLASEKHITIPLTFLPEGTQAEDIQAYKINPSASSTVLLWRQSTVKSSFVNVTPDKFAEVSKAAEAMLK